MDFMKNRFLIIIFIFLFIFNICLLIILSINNKKSVNLNKSNKNTISKIPLKNQQKELKIVEKEDMGWGTVYRVLVRAVSINTRTIEDYQGRPQQVETLTVSFGENTDGTAKLQELLFANPENNVGIPLSKSRYPEIITDENKTYLVSDSEYFRFLQEAVNNKSEILIELPVSGGPMFECTEKNKDLCEFLYELSERNEVNDSIITKLNSNGLIKNDANNFGSIYYIYIPTVIGE